MRGARHKGFDSAVVRINVRTSATGSPNIGGNAPAANAPCDPEPAVPANQSGPLLLSLIDGNPLPKGKIFQHNCVVTFSEQPNQTKTNPSRTSSMSPDCSC